MKQAAVLGIDLGGTKVSGAIFDQAGQLLLKEKILIDQLKGAQVADLIILLINQLRQKADSLSLKITGIGVAVPGIYYREKGTVWAPNIPGWDAYALRQKLEKHTNSEVRVEIDSDRACYILGETWKGIAIGCKHAIFLAVGTGIGAGILVDGTILRGQSDIAGAIGWMTLTDNFIEPYHKHGCFEHHASGNGISQVGSEQAKAELTTEEIFNSYSQGDPLAVKVIENAIFYWGKAAANLVSLFNPEKIIFGGGVFGPARKFLNDIYQEAQKWAQPISIGEVEFVNSALGTEAGLYGAACLVKDRLSSEI